MKYFDMVFTQFVEHQLCQVALVIKTNYQGLVWVILQSLVIDIVDEHRKQVVVAVSELEGRIRELDFYFQPIKQQFCHTRNSTVFSLTHFARFSQLFLKKNNTTAVAE
jgi:hypothetical protein